MGPAEAAAIEESVRVFVDAWKLMVARFPAGAITHAAGVSTALGNVALPFFNVSMHDGPLADTAALRRALALGVARASVCPHPWMIGLCEDWSPSGWETVATEFGLAPAMSLTGMATDCLLPPRRALPDLEIRRVADTTTTRDLATVNMHAYGMPAALFECMNGMHLWNADGFGCVGYEDRRPVSAAAAFPVAGTVYVAFVATMPDAQGKGYAEAAMRHAIAEGRQAMGFTRTTLHATEMGAPLYRNMGFAANARFRLLAADGRGGGGH